MHEAGGHNSHNELMIHIRRLGGELFFLFSPSLIPKRSITACFSCRGPCGVNTQTTVNPWPFTTRKWPCGASCRRWSKAGGPVAACTWSGRRWTVSAVTWATRTFAYSPDVRRPRWPTAAAAAVAVSTGWRTSCTGRAASSGSGGWWDCWTTNDRTAPPTCASCTPRYLYFGSGGQVEVKWTWTCAVTTWWASETLICCTAIRDVSAM